MDSELLKALKKIQALASTGLFYTNDVYNKERFEEIDTISKQLLASMAGVSSQRIDGLVSDLAKGYATPRIDVRGALLRKDRILLVKELDGYWTLPGGFADVGLSGRENIEKEIVEEANLHTEAISVYSIRHKAKHDYDPDVRDFYKLFYLCEQTEPGEPKAGMETVDVGFFALDGLPPLSTARVLKEDIAAAFEYQKNTIRPAMFD